MNGVGGKNPVDGRRKPLLHCPQTDCKATFTKAWRLKEHETLHTGARPCVCTITGCGGRFTRKSHLTRHMLKHRGVKHFTCQFAGCSRTCLTKGRLKRHARYVHGDKDTFYKCPQPKCFLAFRKRWKFKLHLSEHAVAAKFKCLRFGCAATFDSHIARRAHMKKHAGYRCSVANCRVVERTWGKLQKHMAKHPATFTCNACKKVFKKLDGLRRHKRIHASHKPVLVCPRDDCQAYFSTTFNLQHHIRKVHLELLKYKCSFPDCPRMFAMRESMTRHLLRHDPSAPALKKRQRPKKSWQKRLDGHHLPLVEENLRSLFAMRMRISRRAKVETNLAGLFNERKIPHYVDPEVNLRNLFGIKKEVEKPEVTPVIG